MYFIFNECVFLLGLPPDITPDEFVEVMSKWGIVMRDPITEEYKIKLYKDKDGNQKGDGLCCYLKVGHCNSTIKFIYFLWSWMKLIVGLIDLCLCILVKEHYMCLLK